MLRPYSNFFLLKATNWFFISASEIVGKVAVTVSSQDGTWHSVDETEFEYHPNVTQELQKSIREMPYTKRNILLNYETLNPSRSAGIGQTLSSCFSSCLQRMASYSVTTNI